MGILPKNEFWSCLVKPFSSHCLSYKELKLTSKLFAGQTFHGFLIHILNISLQSLDMCRNQNFEFLGLKVTQQSWLFLFAKLSSPFLSISLPQFFSFAGHLVGFILVGRSFWESFYDLRIRWKEGKWVVKQDFHGKFFGQWYMFFFAFFSGLLDCLVLILVWFERSNNNNNNNNNGIYIALIHRCSKRFTLPKVVGKVVLGI